MRRFSSFDESELVEAASLEEGVHIGHRLLFARAADLFESVIQQQAIEVLEVGWHVIYR